MKQLVYCTRIMPLQVIRIYISVNDNKNPQNRNKLFTCDVLFCMCVCVCVCKNSVKQERKRYILFLLPALQICLLFNQYFPLVLHTQVYINCISLPSTIMFINSRFLLSTDYLTAIPFPKASKGTWRKTEKGVKKSIHFLFYF